MKKPFVAIAFLLLAQCGLPGDGTECPGAPEQPWSDLDSEISYPAVGLTRGQVCTAFLVGPTLAVTAAHCIVGNPNDVGAYFRNPTDHAWRLYTGRAILHPDYRVENFLEGGVGFKVATGDIAVIKLDQPATIPPAEIGPTGNQPGVCDRVVIIGYGGDGSTPPPLAGRIQQIMTTTVVWNSSKVFRARGTARHGDSGGPVFSIKNGRPQVVGLVESRPTRGETSYSTYCANLLSPEAGYRDWILSQ